MKTKHPDLRQYLLDGLAERSARKLLFDPMVCEAIDHMADAGCDPLFIRVALDVAGSEHDLMQSDNYWYWDSLSQADRLQVSSRITRALAELHDALKYFEAPSGWAIGKLEIRGRSSERDLLNALMKDQRRHLLGLAEYAESWPSLFLHGAGRTDPFRKRRTLVVCVADSLPHPTPRVPLRRWAWVTTRIVNALFPDLAPLDERATRRIVADAAEEGQRRREADEELPGSP